MQQPIIERIMNEQDWDFIRVLEDMIDVLVARGVITMDMLPRDAVEKLAMRRHMREALIEPVELRRAPDVSSIDRKLAALPFKEMGARRYLTSNTSSTLPPMAPTKP